MNVANNEDFKKNMKKLCVISQNFLVQGKMYNLLTKSYYCVMVNTTVNAVNAAKTTLWQSNVSNLLNQDNSILFEDLRFAETALAMGGFMGGWMEGWVNGWVNLCGLPPLPCLPRLPCLSHVFPIIPMSSLSSPHHPCYPYIIPKSPFNPPPTPTPPRDPPNQ